MKFVVIALALASFSVFATETAKKVVTETTASTVTTVKKTVCPMVNGKEDCTVKEVTTKAIETKKKL